MSVSEKGQVVTNGADGGQLTEPFQFRGNSFTMMVLKVLRPDAPEFMAKVETKVRQAPNFFRNAPVVLDLEELPNGGADTDLEALVAGLRERHLHPIATQHCPAALNDLAGRMKLVAMPTGRAAHLEVTRGDRPLPPPPPAPLYRPPVVVTEPIRSGQQIYVEKADLIVTASVSAGAEVLADGTIHIYGALRGRALAGISGEAGARIFCQSLEAELVSVNGYYQVNEDIAEDRLRKPAQIWQADGCIHIGTL